MKLDLQEKIDRDMALNVSELMAATGYGRVALKRMPIPMVEGKIRLSDFWRHYDALANNIKATAALPALSNAQLLVNAMRAPKI